MTLTGHVIDGHVVLDSPIALPEGAAVRVEILVASSPRSTDDDFDESEPTLAEQLKNFLKHQVDLPPDAAANHDYYLVHGLPQSDASSEQ
jgi:hypothetical protein